MSNSILKLILKKINYSINVYLYISSKVPSEKYEYLSESTFSRKLKFLKILCCRLYKSKYLILMVLATWTSGFGALIATWFERWGRFGLDPEIGSCSILPDVNGRSPKEFLFILAFIAPCVAIVVCYARIFYIVRNTAMKSRRRDKAAIDLVKASLDVNVTIFQKIYHFLNIYYFL